MFLKCSERRKDGKVHRSWSVVESHRYAGGKITACLIKPIKQSRLFDCLIDVIGKSVMEKASARPHRREVPPMPAAQHAPLQKVRILLAEDNVVNHKVALGMLRKPGYMADAVANGLEGLEALKHIPYGIIFMDCPMPELDGFDATCLIRKRERSTEEHCPWPAPVHIVALTANPMQRDRETCLAAGMIDFLTKPMHQADPQTTLERWQPPAPVGRDATPASNPEVAHD